MGRKAIEGQDNVTGTATPHNVLTAPDGAAPGASQLFVRRHDMQVGPAGSGALGGAVQRVRTFGPIQRAEIALSADQGATVIEIDAPRDRPLQSGDIIGLQPTRFRIFAAP